MTTKPIQTTTTGKSRIFLGIFFLASLLELVSNLIPAIPYTIHFIAKSLLMPALLGYFILESRQWEKKYRIPVILALITSFFGDFFLLFSGSSYFLLGLGSFLLAQASYIYTFRKGPFEAEKGRIEVIFMALGGLLILYGILLVYSLWSYLGEMQIPVCVYALVIMGMGLSALGRKGKVNLQSFREVFVGAALFILSDSLIAISRFGSEMVGLSYSGFWIMLTYISAQYLIIRGLLKVKVN
ncbi:MAG: lysoplasmalogenase [Bacteroidota bacterium]